MIIHSQRIFTELFSLRPWEKKIYQHVDLIANNTFHQNPIKSTNPTNASFNFVSLSKVITSALFVKKHIRLKPINGKDLHFSKKIKKKINMKPLGTSQRVLAWFLICPDENSTKRQKWIHIIFTTYIATFNFVGVFTGGLFGLKYIKINLELTLYAVFPTFGLISAVYIMIVASFSRHKINVIFQTLSTIYKASKC